MEVKMMGKKQYQGSQRWPLQRGGLLIGWFTVYMYMYIHAYSTSCYTCTIHNYIIILISCLSWLEEPSIGQYMCTCTYTCILCIYNVHVVLHVHTHNTSVYSKVQCMWTNRNYCTSNINRNQIQGFLPYWTVHTLLRAHAHAHVHVHACTIYMYMYMCIYYSSGSTYGMHMYMYIGMKLKMSAFTTYTVHCIVILECLSLVCTCTHTCTCIQQFCQDKANKNTHEAVS